MHDHQTRVAGASHLHHGRVAKSRHVVDDGRARLHGALRHIGMPGVHRHAHAAAQLGDDLGDALPPSSEVTGAEPGRVDSPPTSMMAAPCSTMSSAWAMAASNVAFSPPSENESGVMFRMPMMTGGFEVELKR